MTDYNKFTLADLRTKVADHVRAGRGELPEGETLHTVRTAWLRPDCVEFLSAIEGDSATESSEMPSESTVLPVINMSGTNAPQSPVNALEEAIRAIAGTVRQQAPELDIAAIKKLISGEVASELLNLTLPRTVSVSMPDRVPVDVGFTHCDFDKVLKLATLRRNPSIWISGPTGCGKSLMVEQIAQSLGLPFYSHIAAVMPSDLMGYLDATGTYRGTQLFEAFTKGGVCLLDENDAYSERALLSINELIASGTAVFGNVRYTKHKDFILFAGANTWGSGATIEYTGRNRLDAAYLNRFDFRVAMDYDEKLEEAVMGKTEWTNACHKARKLARETSVKVIISLRHIKSGQALINSGFSMLEAVRMTWGAGLDDQTLAKLAAKV